MPKDKEVINGEKISKLEAEVHGINTSFAEFKDEIKGLIDKLFTNLEQHTNRKPISIPVIISSIAAIFVVIAGLLGVVIWIVNTSNAPILTQMSQLTQVIQSVNTNTNNNTNLIQLTNKELSGIKEGTLGNTETLRWMLFDENLPKQVTEVQKDIEYIQRDLEYIKQRHEKGEK